VKKTFSRIIRWEYFWLCLILVITLALHFTIINGVKAPILDEVYYYGSAPGSTFGDGYSIIQNHKDLRPEHPPLGKLFVVAGIEAFGDNTFGWRVPSIIMGTLGIILFFLICRRLNMSRRATNIATFLLAFENFTFTLASIAMLDVFMMTLTLAFFLLYLYREYLLSGVFIGLAALSKLFAAMATPTLLIHWIFSKTKPSRWFALTIITAPISFVALMPLFDFAISRQFQSPVARIKDMLTLSGSLTFANTTHPSLSRPWEWVLNYIPMPFWFGPHYPGNTWLGGYNGAISPTIWMVVIPIVLFMLYRAVKGNEAGLFGFAWFFGTYILWIPISIATNRISFVYYFYPTVGALCLGLGLCIDDILIRISTRVGKVKISVMTGIGAFFLLHIASFIILAPVFFPGK
jgi:dolichyl-phosphate-mannose-protein mannosyltransferase